MGRAGLTCEDRGWENPTNGKSLETCFRTGFRDNLKDRDKRGQNLEDLEGWERGDSLIERRGTTAIAALAWVAVFVSDALINIVLMTSINTLRIHLPSWVSVARALISSAI
jgi:hypothetical protein